MCAWGGVGGWGRGLKISIRVESKEGKELREEEKRQLIIFMIKALQYLYFSKACYNAKH